MKKILFKKARRVNRRAFLLDREIAVAFSAYSDRFVSFNDERIAMDASIVPVFDQEEVQALAKKHYGIDATVKKLDSYIDQNFHLTTTTDASYVLKIANAEETASMLEAQNAILEFLNEEDGLLHFPNVHPDLQGNTITLIPDASGRSFRMRLLSFLPGTFMSAVSSFNHSYFQALGEAIGEMDACLLQFAHGGAHRYLNWDLRNIFDIRPLLETIADPAQKRLVDYFLLQLETHLLPLMPHLPMSIIHNDANDNNLLVREENNQYVPAGLIDFGDLVYTYTVCELAITAAYAMFNKEDPLAVADAMLRGYHDRRPLSEAEVDAFFWLTIARVCMSVTFSAAARLENPENEYISVSEAGGWRMLETMLSWNPAQVQNRFRAVCGMKQLELGRDKEAILASRDQHIGKSLSISYQQPLKIIRGAFQYLYDENGQQYLDCVNNVCHVGHCHPTVARAAREQITTLNTNTRYLHDNLISYAERLTATLPDPLNVCIFVNSGSEANDLALRMARHYTGNDDILTVDGAYHGHTAALINISPYKFNSPGGKGKVDNVHIMPMPDTYRGQYKATDEKAGEKYARAVHHAIAQLKAENKGPAVFISESMLSCGGQIMLPEGYFQHAFAATRAAGGVCIADEVQVGFGRAGKTFWAFEMQGVVPDIVTVGKPIGNGHPLAAVITTREIADAFNNGMEYFNTFGGNPVSCAVGMAVLDVIEKEGLQQNALERGEQMLAGFRCLQEKYDLIGDVRGNGLFVGMELVRDRTTLEPAADEASKIVNSMKQRYFLLSTDGPLHNVIKIKPPIVFSEKNVEDLVSNLDEVLGQV